MKPLQDEDFEILCKSLSGYPTLQQAAWSARDAFREGRLQDSLDELQKVDPLEKLKYAQITDIEAQAKRSLEMKAAKDRTDPRKYLTPARIASESEGIRRAVQKQKPALDKYQEIIASLCAKMAVQDKANEDQSRESGKNTAMPQPMNGEAAHNLTPERVMTPLIKQEDIELGAKIIVLEKGKERTLIISMHQDVPGSLRLEDPSTGRSYVRLTRVVLKAGASGKVFICPGNSGKSE